MTQSKNAQNMFLEGFNCAQSVFSTYGEGRGIDTNLARKIAEPFGGGMARLGEVCGAVTGALMVIGLKHGVTDAADGAARDRCYELVNRFAARFREKHGSIICRELVACDISDNDERLKAAERGVFGDLCPRLVEDAGLILEEILHGTGG
ncbi:MAG: C_GCAxxG_C_C family protein [Deltaproteobacteria bacterium]|nr:C_GCAxxG_C_C family protein [Candidatus Zymogenaceae bacterium]